MKSILRNIVAGWVGYLYLGTAFAFGITFVSALTINLFMRIFN